MQDIFIRKGWTHPEDCPKANAVSENSFYLPSTPDLTEEDLDYIVENLRTALITG